MAKCRPHDWLMPDVRDWCLICRVCERRLDLWTEMTEQRAYSIIKSAGRKGAEYQDEFGERLYAAWNATADRRAAWKEYSRQKNKSIY